MVVADAGEVVVAGATPALDGEQVRVTKPGEVFADGGCRDAGLVRYGLPQGSITPYAKLAARSASPPTAPLPGNPNSLPLPQRPARDRADHTKMRAYNSDP